jgi:predicted ATPase/DNA-binding CsgD family transcriptional regulator
VTSGFASSVRFVDLSPIEDVEAGRSLIRAALDRSPPTGPTCEDPDRSDGRERHTLLVLDSCEHLLPGLAREVAKLLAANLQVVILATSREPFHLRWEHRLRIRPLDLPDLEDASPEALLTTPAIALFVARARAVSPDFEVTRENSAVVAALCRRLDGLPLAIEQAAAGVDLLEPAMMLDRLDQNLALPLFGAEDAPVRHRTLDAAIGWSYARLHPAEQALFRRVAILSGAWTLEAAEVVGDTASLELDALNGLITLVDKGLLSTSSPVAGRTRFTMLETIRSVGIRQLQLAGELGETSERLARLGGSAEPEYDDLTDVSREAQRASPSARARPARSPLSERETAVLCLIGEGLPSKRIGRELGLAERTVKAHVTGAMNKLGAFSRAQALGVAITRGYLEIDGSGQLSPDPVSQASQRSRA